MRPPDVLRVESAVKKLADPTLTPRALGRAVVAAACVFEECRALLTDEDAERYWRLITASHRRVTRLRDHVQAMHRLGAGLT